MIATLKREKIDSQIRLINTILRKDGIFINSRFCFFLGAGCSVSSGIPLASQIISILRKLVFIDYHSSLNKIIRSPNEPIEQYLASIDAYILKYEIDFTDFISTIESQFLKMLEKNKSRFHRYVSDARSKKDEMIKSQFIQDNLYGLWFEKYSRTPRKRQALIEQIIENIEPSVSYILLAQLIKNGYVRNIFTTNFDDLLNYSLLKYCTEKPKVFFHNELAKFIRFDDRKANIIKLHGDFLFENIKNINSETKFLDTNMEEKFLEGLSNRDIVFLGYNGADESIMNTLIRVRKENKFTIYWCGFDEKMLHWRVIKLLNESNDAYFIKIRSFDDFIFELYNQDQEKYELDIIKRAIMTEAKVKDYLAFFNKRRFKRSHKICPEEFSPIEDIQEGIELIKKIDLSSSPSETIVKYYKILYELNPDVNWVKINYSVSLLRAGLHSDALVILSSAMKDHFDDYLLWYNLGVVYHDMNRLKEARDAFLLATKVNPQFANGFNNLAATYNSQREYSQALTTIDKAIEIERKGKFLVLKGIILKNLKHFEEANKLYDEAISLKEDILEALLNKSNVLRLLESYELAEKFSKEALKIDTEHEYIYATLAQICAERGDTTNFYHFLTEALKRNYPLWRHLDDRAFVNYKKEERFKNLLKEYSPMNI